MVSVKNEIVGIFVGLFVLVGFIFMSSSFIVADLISFSNTSSGVGDIFDVRNGTNHTFMSSSFNHIMLNVSFSNGTAAYETPNFMFEGTAGIVDGDDPVNVSFYLLSAGTATFLGNASICAASEGAGYNVSCWGNISVSTANDGFWNITATVYNNTGSTNQTWYNLTDIYFDSTPPAVYVANFSNVAETNYTQSYQYITFNVSVLDETIGVDSVFFNVTNSTGRQNGTFYAESVGGYYVNDTVNLSYFLEGTYNVTVYANDTRTNNLNSSTNAVNLKVDNTAPSSVTLTRNDDSTRTSLTIDVVVADALSGPSYTTACTVDRSNAAITGTGGSVTLTESGLSCRTEYSYVVTCSDSVGFTKASSSTTFTTNACSGDASPGSSGSTSTSTWTNTFAEDGSELSELGSVNRALRVKNRVKLDVSGTAHYVGVKALTASTATVEVSSTPQETILALGDVRKFDLDGDGDYDLSVTLNSIEGGKADITILPLSEAVTAESEQAQDAAAAAAAGQQVGEGGPGLTGEEGEEGEEGGSNLLTIVLVILAVVVIAAVIVYVVKKRK
jgi:hypothetical protein